MHNERVVADVAEIVLPRLSLYHKHGRACNAGETKQAGRVWYRHQCMAESCVHNLGYSLRSPSPFSRARSAERRARATLHRRSPEQIRRRRRHPNVHPLQPTQLRLHPHLHLLRLAPWQKGKNREPSPRRQRQRSRVTTRSRRCATIFSDWTAPPRRACRVA